MKKLSALVLAVCFVLGTLGSAAAIDVKVKGNWHFSYGYFGNWSMYDGDTGAEKGDLDPFQARMRSRTQIEFIASETLSAMLHFEIGVFNYGEKDSGAQLDTDGKNVKTKWAALDWTIPQTKTHIRMGLSRVSLPAFIFGDNFVMTADAAGVIVNQEITPEVGITGFWVRPYDQNAKGDQKNLDAMDLFALMVPIKTNVIRVTPFGMIGVVGKNTPYNDGYKSSRIVIDRGRYVPAGARKDHGVAWWAGLNFELPIIDPFFFKFEGMYGRQSNNELNGVDYSQRGYFLAAQFGYKFDWGKASLIGWYGSGDSNDSEERYGTIPVVSTDGGFALGTHAFAGNRFLQRDGGISNTGAGTWGWGVAIDDVSFVPNLTHGLRAFMFRGTNKADRVQGSDPLYLNNGWDSGHNAYMISSDFGITAAWTNTYKFNDNFLMGLDFGYTYLDLSNQRSSANRDTNDMYTAILSFGYSF